ncbi:hypothetical protein ACWD2L_06035 [Streptomyces sp. NPDC002754]
MDVLYRSICVARHWLPDDRLAHTVITAGADGEPDVLTFGFRAWRIHPALVAELNDFGAALANTDMYEFDLERVGGPSEVCAWFEAVPEHLMPPGEIMTPHVDAPPNALPCIELRCRADLIDPDMIREINEYVLPQLTGLMVPARWRLNAA